MAASNQFDAIVVGSGMSGGWAAKELCEKGLETLVLVKSQDGGWKIRHSHTSSRPARRPPA